MADIIGDRPMTPLLCLVCAAVGLVVGLVIGGMIDEWTERRRWRRR